jgi:hypothetical protein
MVGMALSNKPLNIKIAFLDVGQGDTAVVSCPDTREAIVVDCINADAVLDYLKQEQIRYLRGVIITHLHADHYSEVDYLLYRCNLVPGMSECERLGFSVFDKKIYDKLAQDGDEHSLDYEKSFQDRKGSKHTPLKTMRRWCKNDKSKYFLPQVQGRPQTLPFDGTLAKSIYLIHPYIIDVPDLATKGLNNTSVILHIIGSGSSALLTGDLEPTGWKELIANYPNLRSDVLKFPHHGGAWNGVEASNLLDRVKPSVVVISVGTEGKKYNHPNPEVFAALSKHPGIRILCTQATDQCHRDAAALNERASIDNQFKAQAGKSDHWDILSRKGCPCAGTVIIELSEKARVIQPRESCFITRLS